MSSRLSQIRFGEICEVDRQIVSPQDLKENKSYVGLEDIESNSGRILQYHSLSKLDLKSAKFRFSAKHILYGKLRPYLNKVALPDRAGVCSTDILPILPNADKADRLFLSYLMRTPLFSQLATERASGANLPRISPNELVNFKIPSFSLQEQNKVGQILFKIESALEKRQQTLRLADDFLKSAFLEMFGAPGTNSKGFKTKPIKDLVKKILNEDPKRYPDKGYSYVDISSVDNQLKKITETKQIFGSDAPSRARQLLQAQDILVSTVRPNLNAVGMLPNGLTNPIGSTGFCVLRANIEAVRPEYLFEICKTPFFIHSLVNVAKGASYPAVSDSDILGLWIPLHPLS